MSRLRSTQAVVCFYGVAMTQDRPRDRFHGRIGRGDQPCSQPGCPLPGEFRAPNPYGATPGFDGPGEYLWFCLDHIREFNARYDWFSGMTRDEIEEAQMPMSGWERESRAFRPTAGVDEPPRWADFSDPLEAISGRFRQRRDAAAPAPRDDGHWLTPEDRRAMKVLGLTDNADRRALRGRYSELVRQYHPDRNGGDRRHEKKLQAVVEAYQLLRKSPAFGG